MRQEVGTSGVKWSHSAAVFGDGRDVAAPNADHVLQAVLPEGAGALHREVKGTAAQGWRAEGVCGQ